MTDEDRAIRSEIRLLRSLLDAERAKSAELEREFAKVADILEPHWRGAGAKLEATWMVKTVADLGRALDDADMLEWQPITEAKKDGTPIWACFRTDLVAYTGRSDLEQWADKQVPLRHPGIANRGNGEPFDIGWNIFAPVGHGGFPDDWISGWRSMPPPPSEKDHSPS